MKNRQKEIEHEDRILRDIIFSTQSQVDLACDNVIAFDKDRKAYIGKDLVDLGIYEQL